MAANTEAVSITITAAKVTTATITLKPIISGDGTGTLKYNITAADVIADITDAEMKLTGIGISHTASVDISDKMDGADYTITVPVGYYYVDFVIEVESGDKVTFRQVVLISENMISFYEFTILRNNFYAVLKEDSTNFTYEDITDTKPTITYVITAASDGLPTATGTYSTKINVKRGDTVTFTVSNASVFTANSFEWYCVDTGLTLGTANTCAITASGDFNYAKEYHLTVIGLLTADSKKYSTVVNFEVIP